MTDLVTLEQVQALAARLPPKEQLKLVARIGEQLSAALPERSSSAEKAEALLAELDAFAASLPVRNCDSAKDMRQIRQERASRL
jgi:hypothetical protein